MDAGCRVECCFCRLELLEACLCMERLECCGSLIAGFCRVECLETRGTVAGRSLHGMSLVVVVFLVEELILYAELLDCVWKHCRIHCIRRNLVVLVLFVETPLYSKID